MDPFIPSSTPVFCPIYIPQSRATPHAPQLLPTLAISFHNPRLIPPLPTLLLAGLPGGLGFWFRGT
ncbi:hypothetical protein BDV06DRAFT_187329 [Aspergillus oleicola]